MGVRWFSGPLAGPTKRALRPTPTGLPHTCAGHCSGNASIASREQEPGARSVFDQQLFQMLQVPNVANDNQGGFVTQDSAVAVLTRYFCVPAMLDILTKGTAYFTH